MPAIPLPEFPRTAAWLNTPAPLRLAHELKGQIVLLCFFSYTNIHCLCALEELRQLQKKYAARPVVTIAIHSPKYPADTAAVAAAIQRLDIRCPVIVDSDHEIWNRLDITAWPTFLLLGPDAATIGAVSGDGHLPLLENAIDRALAKSETQPSEPRPLRSVHVNALRETPTPIPNSQFPVPNSLPPVPIHYSPFTIHNSLSFPTKIIAAPAHNRLFILDTAHHRILITSLPNQHHQLTLQHVIGSGTPGHADGNFHTASFHRPQGFIANSTGDVLFLADTANHLVRRIDIKSQYVHTILGTGQPRFDHEAGKTGREQPLSSPWDLALANNRLYIAQAGQHQIFAMNLMTAMTEVAAGTAREGLYDGPALLANLAQPSALALDPTTQTLYFTDAQSSALRALNLRSKTITTLIGKGLFDFGDTIGQLVSARLQHPLALALSPDRQSLLLADTLNHKIKIVNLAAQTIRTLSPENLDLSEPAGLTPLPTPSAPNALLIADTNHHRLLHLNPDTHECHTITIDISP